MAYVFLGVHRRSETVIAARSRQIHPLCGQGGVGLTHSAHGRLSNWRISTAVWRFNMSLTARAS